MPIWVDGRLIDEREADGARAGFTRPGCQTTARVRAGTADFFDRHVARLVRDAPLLGRAWTDRDQVRDAFRSLARAAFGESGEGVIRLELRPRDDGSTVLIGIPRALGEDAPTWRATLAPSVHPGPGPHPGVKLTEHPSWTAGRSHAARHGCDEALLADGRGLLVEGARSALIVVARDGTVGFPDPALGGVASIGLAVVVERASGLEPRRIPVASLADAREVIAVNAVRGIRPIVAIDGRSVGDGRPGPVARQLARLFEAAIQEESRSSR